MCKSTWNKGSVVPRRENKDITNGIRAKGGRGVSRFKTPNLSLRVKATESIRKTPDLNPDQKWCIPISEFQGFTPGPPDIGYINYNYFLIHPIYIYIYIYMYV
jgi:hypothetical protein